MGRIKDACCEPCKPSAKEIKERQKWEAQMDLDTLLSAARIKKDKARFGRALAIAKERKSELAAVTPKEMKS